MTVKNIVILGAGYGGLKVTKRLCTLLRGNSEYRIVLINQHRHHTLNTLLHEAAVGVTDYGDVIIPLDKVLQELNVNLIIGTATDIDFVKRIVLLDNGTEGVSFEFLVLALGSEPEYFGIEGLQEHSLSLDSLASAQQINQKLKEILKMNEDLRLPTGVYNEPVTFVVGGGGLTGVEFAGELAYFLKSVNNHNPILKYKIIQIEADKQLLPGMSNQVATYAEKTLSRLGVEVIKGDIIKKVTPTTLYLSSGCQIKYTLIVWSGGVRAKQLIQEAGLKTNARGRLLINKYLQYVEDQFIYALGDSANVIDPLTNRGILPTAQAAIQQGELVAYNIYADIKGISKKPFQAGRILLCINVGRRRGLAEMNKFRLTGISAACLKKVIPLKYRYTLGGLKLLLGRN